jgi:predicted metal-binding membrane protein
LQHRLVISARRPLSPGVAVICLAAAAWLVMIAFSLTGNGAVVRHDRLLGGSLPLWDATALFVAGWQVMLWAMMVPVAVGAIKEQPRPSLFIAGYLLAWTAFGLACFVFDLGVHASVNHFSWIADHSPLIPTATILGVAIYQVLTPKRISLVRCRQFERNVGPASDPGAGGVRSGLHYGVLCVGANGALMLLAFAIGPNSLVLMIAITALMLWELTPEGVRSLRITGVALFAAAAVSAILG